MKLSIIAISLFAVIGSAQATNLSVTYDPVAVSQARAASAITNWNDSVASGNADNRMASSVVEAVNGLNGEAARNGNPSVSIPMASMSPSSDPTLQGFDVLTHNTNINGQRIIQAHIDAYQVQIQRYNDALVDWNNNHQDAERLQKALKEMEHSAAYLANHGVMMNGSLTINHSMVDMTPASKPPVVTPTHQPEIEVDPVEDVIKVKVNPIKITPKVSDANKAAVTANTSADAHTVTEQERRQAQEVSAHAARYAHKEAPVSVTNPQVLAAVHETATKTPVVHAQTLTVSNKPTTKATPHQTATAHPVTLVGSKAPVSVDAKPVTQTVASHGVSSYQAAPQVDSVTHEELNKQNHKLSAGIAGVYAFAGIPQVQGKKVSIGAGVGNYEGEQALSVGAVVSVSDSVTAKVGFSMDSQSNVGEAAGVSVGF